MFFFTVIGLSAQRQLAYEKKNLTSLRSHGRIVRGWIVWPRFFYRINNALPISKSKDNASHYWWCGFHFSYFLHVTLYIYTRETPDFGEISLAFRGSGAIGAPIGETAAFGSGEQKKNWSPWAPQIVLKTWPVPWDSKYVLGFEIGQRESGFYRERTDTQSDTATQYGISI